MKEKKKIEQELVSENLIEIKEIESIYVSIAT